MSNLKWHLQIEPGTWVLWGYGPKRGVVHVDRDKLDLGYGMSLPFELPEKGVAGGEPQEYERRRGYGWRWNTEDGTAGHSWHFADTIDAAVEAAKKNLKAQRHDTQVLFSEAIRDVRIGSGRKTAKRKGR